MEILPQTTGMPVVFSAALVNQGNSVEFQQLPVIGWAGNPLRPIIAYGGTLFMAEDDDYLIYVMPDTGMRGAMRVLVINDQDGGGWYECLDDIQGPVIEHLRRNRANPTAAEQFCPVGSRQRAIFVSDPRVPAGRRI